MESRYKAAAIIFYRYKYVSGLKRTILQVYLQYEKKFKSWSHFGGKREVFDRDSFATAFRELVEEKSCSDTLLCYLHDNILPKKYFFASKMMVYYVHISPKNTEFIEANWFAIDWLPSNIRSHIIEQIEEIKTVDLVRYFSNCNISTTI